MVVELEKFELADVVDVVDEVVVVGASVVGASVVEVAIVVVVVDTNGPATTVVVVNGIWP